jgi:hypothetical protein
VQEAGSVDEASKGRSVMSAQNIIYVIVCVMAMVLCIVLLKHSLSRYCYGLDAEIEAERTKLLIDQLRESEPKLAELVEDFHVRKGINVQRSDLNKLRKLLEEQRGGHGVIGRTPGKAN